MKPSGLPIDAVLPELLAGLAGHSQLLLQAPPGAGKSTVVPLALLHAPWRADRKILLLEPRRLAARAIAARMAALRDEPVGATVGYRMRMDRKTGPATRLEVLTEGMLTRRLQRDPELHDVAAVIFDEFHERSLQADLGLALSLEVQAALRPDLRILVMSATLDLGPLQGLLPEAVTLRAEGQSHPVSVHYAPAPSKPPGTQELAATIRQALQRHAGDVLVFLPGIADIRRLHTRLAEQDLPGTAQVLPLYGDLPAADQDRAIRPSIPGTRKIVLATNIAETSLTIDGVGIVVDSGWSRRSRFEPGSGMSRLETVRVSLASAEQRAGRAGRLGPGVCYRLWTEAEQRRLAQHAPAEMLEADLGPLALELARWGTQDPTRLAWLDPPPAAAYRQAQELLRELGALDPGGRVTAEGSAMADLGLHPRLAHMLLRARELGAGRLGCCLAAVLSERDFLKSGSQERDLDLAHRVRLVCEAAAREAALDLGGFRRTVRTAEHFSAQLAVAAEPKPVFDQAMLARLAACAYPDRIAKCRPGSATRYLLRNGKGALMDAAQVFPDGEYLVITGLDAGQREARIHSALPIDPRLLRDQFAGQITTSDRVEWDRQEQAVIARSEERLGALLLSERTLPSPDPEAIAAALLDGVRELGIECLPWTEAWREWQARVSFIGRHFGEDPLCQDWPQVQDSDLLQQLNDWLTPHLAGMSRRDHLARLDLGAALTGLLRWDQRQQLETQAPTHYVVPSGSRIAIRYADQDTPALAVRLQELFGLAETPRIAAGRVPLSLHLLSPAGRPVQITSDLARFWAVSYFEVRKDLRGRYPKHPWPDDPLHAEPTRRSKKSPQN